MKKTKPKRHGDAIKKLRAVLGMSQDQFAAMIGVSAPLIKAIEIGNRKITEGLDRRIRVATGASMFGFPRGRYTDGKFSIVTGVPTCEPRSCWGKGPYTIETFRHHQTKFQTSVEAAKSNLEEMIPELESLFIAAGKPGKSAIRYRLPSLVLSLQEWIEESKKQFNLK